MYYKRVRFLSTNKWNLPAGATSIGGNSAETLPPVTLMRGVGGSRDVASCLHKIAFFNFFTSSSLSIIALLGKGYSW